MGSLRGARVLVTGADGFIGSHLTRRLVSDGAEVHALTSDVSSVFPRRLLDLRGQMEIHEGNLMDRGAMDTLARSAKPAYIFHLAAYTHVGKSWQRVDECIQANIQGTMNLLQALADQGYERFVNTGTSEIYGDIEVPFREDAVVNPISPYSVSKYAAERFCRLFQRAYGWPIVMLRPFNAYGPAQSPDRVIPEIIVRALRKEELKMTAGAADPRVQLRRGPRRRVRQGGDDAGGERRAVQHRRRRGDLDARCRDADPRDDGQPHRAAVRRPAGAADRDHEDVLRLLQGPAAPRLGAEPLAARRVWRRRSSGIAASWRPPARRSFPRAPSKASLAR